MKSDVPSTSGINRDEWLKALTEAGLEVHEDDQSAISIQEFADLFRVHYYTASRRLNQLVAKGKAVKTRKHTRGADGRRMSMVAYRLVQEQTHGTRDRADADHGRRDRTRAGGRERGRQSRVGTRRG
jgi:hypothetical protein